MDVSANTGSQYIITDCAVTIGDYSYPVLGFVLKLQHNGIPSITVDIDPGRYHLSDPEATQRAEQFTLETFLNVYKELDSVAQLQLEERLCQFSFVAYSAADTRQQLKLENWLMLSAGFVISTMGELGIQVELVHPVYATVEGSGRFFGNLLDTEDAGAPATAEGETLYSGIRTGLFSYLERLNADVGTSSASEDFTGAGLSPLELYITSEGYKDAVDHLTRAVEAYGEHIGWENLEGEGWPTGEFAGLEWFMQMALWRYIQRLGESNTLWDWLVNTIFVDWFVHMRCNYWDTTLWMSPFRPYEAPSFYIDDTDISQCEILPYTPRSLRGVYTRSAIRTTENPHYLSANTAEGLVNAEAIWLEKDAPGELMPIEPPAWVEMMSQDMGADLVPALQAPPLENNLGYNNAEKAPELPAVIDNIPSVVQPLESKLQQICKQRFVESYKDNYQISLQTRLLIAAGWGETTTAGNETMPEEPAKNSNARGPRIVAPGYVVAVCGPGAGGRYEGTNMPRHTLFKMFITTVEHHVDCKTKSAYTQIVGSYARHAEHPDTLEAILKPPTPTNSWIYDENLTAREKLDRAGILVPGMPGQPDQIIPINDPRNYQPSPGIIA